MSARPDAPALRDFLARIGRRRTAIAAAEGAAAGLALALITSLGLRIGTATAAILGLTLAVVGVALRIALSRRGPAVAELVERRAGGCRNVVVTAAELVDRPAGARADIRARVLHDADRAIARLEPAALFPARRAVVGVTVAAVALAVALVAGRPERLSGAPDPARGAASIDGIDVTVTAPAYSARPERVLRDPARVEGLAGSRIRLAVRAVAESVAVETLGGRQILTPGEPRSFAGEFVADADGFIAVTAFGSAGPGVRRLIGLSVTPDRAPRVRITVPGRDLFIADTRRTLDVTIEADDDLALSSLRLRHTKVSGVGERFTFTDGETAIAIVRTDERTWRGRGRLALAPLALEPGDVVVYRGVATDRRPGAPLAESDAFLVEITSPGAVASEGFAMDDENDRYAVSQQMVILKTERLLAARASMTPAAVREEAIRIAAEQRQVRAEFVFMMGGELAGEVMLDSTGLSRLDEEEEAEAGDDILAGRLANRGRVELNQAIRAMSRADGALVAVEVDSALVIERLALEHLQRAFSRTRYILRALTERERLDLSRRLTGTLSDARRDVRPPGEPPADPRVTALRRALASLAGVGATGALDPEAGETIARIAQEILRADPTSEVVQRVTGRLTDAGAAIARGRPDEARTLIDSGAVELARIVRVALLDSPAASRRLDLSRLHGMLTDSLHRRGRPR